ncbi:unnamed protein product [Urochloa decumbens]|uniref:Protein kinase domain-containing protein n=1 Tax=Urochloa decumbens TaxID=240449 RepID=A0ABC8XZ71_9POAL
MGWTSAFFGRLMKSDSSSTSALDVPELRARELNKATRSFSSARLIGEGSSIHNNGTVVYRATLPDGTAAAAKVLGRPPSSGRWGASEDAFLRQQVSLLSTLRHDNLVRLLGYTIAPDLHVLLYEFATVGTLHDVLHGPRGEPQPGSGSRPAVTLSWEQRTRIALDAARGLQYLHEAAAVTHWGINSTNVLLFQGLRAKIADYDVFEQGDGDMRACNRRATPINVACVPPEYVTRGSRVARNADVYGFGVVLLELLTGRKSFDATLGPSHSMLVHWAIPLLRQGGIEQWIDPKLGTQYPPAEALKLARIAQQCLHGQARSRPSMGVVAQMISDIVRD